MLKKILPFTLGILITLITFSIPTLAANIIASPTTSTVIVDGKQVAFNAYNINDSNYFKLREIAYALNKTEKQFKVVWDSDNDAIFLTSKQPYTAAGGEMAGRVSGNKTATQTNSRIILDGSDVQFTAYQIEGSNYFKLRDVGQAFRFNVSWDDARNTIIIDTSKEYSTGRRTSTNAGFVPPAYVNPYIIVTGATVVIDDIIYAKPGQIILIEGINTSSYLVMEMGLNGASVYPEVKIADTDYYTVTPVTNKQSTLVFKNTAPVGYHLPIQAGFFGEERIYGSNGPFGWNWAYRGDRSKTAIVIPEDCSGVVKGSDGKIYLTYSNGAKREFKNG